MGRCDACRWLRYWGGIARGFPRQCGHFSSDAAPDLIRGLVRVADPGSGPGFEDQLKLILKLLGQIFDVVRWPVLNVHAKVQTHA